MLQVKALILHCLFQCGESHTIILALVHTAVNQRVGRAWRERGGGGQLEDCSACGKQKGLGFLVVFFCLGVFLLAFSEAALVPFIFNIRGCSSDDSFCK